jgi:hypothetical protein
VAEPIRPSMTVADRGNAQQAALAFRDEPLDLVWPEIVRVVELLGGDPDDAKASVAGLSAHGRLLGVWLAQDQAHPYPAFQFEQMGSCDRGSPRRSRAC